MKFRKLLSVVLSAALMVSSVSLSAFAKETEDRTYHYVALGDSITSGFGLENPTGKFVDEPTLTVTEELIANPIQSAYPAIFGTYLDEIGKANGYTTTTTNIAATAYRAEDIAQTILRDDGYVGPVATWMISQDRLPEMMNYHNLFCKYISEAELVSVLIGGNDIILNVLSLMCMEENPVIRAMGTSLIWILAGIDVKYSVEAGIQIIEDNKESIDYQVLAEAAEYISNISFENYINLSVANTENVIDAVRTVNDSADIVMLDMFNAYGNSLVYEGQVNDMSYVITNVFARAAGELADIETDDEEQKAAFADEEKVNAFSAYVKKFKKLSAKVTKYNKAAADKLVEIISDEIAYPLQYMLMGKGSDTLVKTLNNRLKTVADEKGCKFVDVYDITNECNIDPHPNAQGHKDIADIMRTELSGMINERMSGTAIPEAEKVTLSERTVTVTAGNTYQLSATVAPFNASQSVKWKTTNKNVATVDSKGTVTALKEGTALITATAENGKTAVCKVTVSKKQSALQILLKSLFKK